MAEGSPVNIAQQLFATGQTGAMGGGGGSVMGGGFGAGTRLFGILPGIDKPLPSLEALSPLASLNQPFSIIGGKRPRPGLLGDFWQRIALQGGPTAAWNMDGVQPLNLEGQSVQQAGLGGLSAPTTPAAGGGGHEIG